MARHGLSRSARWKRRLVSFAVFQVLFTCVIVAIVRWSSVGPGPADLPALAADQPLSLGLTNCSRGLTRADRNQLSKEVINIVRSLANDNPWLATVLEEPQGLFTKGEGPEPIATEVPRPVDEVFGRQTDTSVPGVEDVHAELKKILDDGVATMATTVPVALRRQKRTSALDLGVVASDDLRDVESIPIRVRFLNRLAAEVAERGLDAHVAIVATVGADLAGVRKELLPWMQYHTELGVSKFYILYNGHDEAAVAALEQVRHVSLIHVHPPWASAKDGALLDLYAGLSRQWKGRPGNYALMVTQGYGQQEALARAKRDGVHWLLHLDPDELFYPGGPSTSIASTLARVPAHVASVRFMNHEGQAEAGDLVNRYEQISLFRVHKHDITPEAHYYRNRFKLGANPSFLILYANGKSAVRVDAPGVHHRGPHFWGGEPSPRWQSTSNPDGEFTTIVDDASVVLHYTYSYMSDVEQKAHRSCPDEYLAAARAGDKSKLHECFVIQTDQDAYIAAATGPEAVRDFFYSRFVLSEGVSVACRDPDLSMKARGRLGWCSLTDIPRITYLLEKIGLYRRIHLPAMVLRHHEQRIVEMQRGGFVDAGTTVAAPANVTTALTLEAGDYTDA